MKKTIVVNSKTGKRLPQHKKTNNQLKRLYGKDAFNIRGKKILTKFEFINRYDKDNYVKTGIGNLGYIAYLK